MQLSVNVWVSLCMPASWAKKRELQQHLISLYTSKDNQKIGNTGGIGKNALHIEMSGTRKLIKTCINTTLKKCFLLTYGIRVMKRVISVRKFSGKVRGNAQRDAAVLTTKLSIIKSPSVSCNIKILCFSFGRFS